VMLYLSFDDVFQKCRFCICCARLCKLIDLTGNSTSFDFFSATQQFVLKFLAVLISGFRTRFRVM